MAHDEPVGQSRRNLLKEYDKTNVEFVATTRPYKSVVYFPFEVVDGSVASGVSFAVLRAQTVQEFFGYGKGDQIPVIGNLGIFKTATDADTNLSRGRRTNGVEDFIVEGISATGKEVRVRYATLPSATDAIINDNDVTRATNGNGAIVDPAAIIAPPQAGSPFNLEFLLYEALKPHCAIDFVWDRRNFIPVGTLDQIPEGGAKSLLKASGDPRTDNRYKIPEGYVWRRTDKPDGDFAVRATIADPVVVPINLVQLPADSAVSLPTHLVLGVAMRLHGLGLGQPGQNVG